MSQHDKSTTTLCLAGSFFENAIRIPDNKAVMDYVLTRGGRKKQASGGDSDYMELCAMYEEYLFVQVHQAIKKILEEPQVYRKHRYIRVHVDLVGQGLQLPNVGLLPFHIAHYGFQRIDSETSNMYWSRRHKDSWMANGIPLHPFRYVQDKLAKVGYYLVDMSFMGIDPHFRLYYRGFPPSNKDYFDHVHRKIKNLSESDFNPKHYYWHGLHTYTPLSIIN